MKASERDLLKSEAKAASLENLSYAENLEHVLRGVLREWCHRNGAELCEFGENKKRQGEVVCVVKLADSYYSAVGLRGPGNPYPPLHEVIHGTEFGADILGMLDREAWIRQQSLGKLRLVEVER